jgi:hypothetical protein
MFRKRDRLLRLEIKERFVVTLKAGPMFSGMLIDADDRTFHFADVRLVQTNGSVPADGQLYIERANVAYLQRVARTEEE